MDSAKGIRYCMTESEITEVIGLSPSDIKNAEVSVAKVFNMPQFIAIDGISYFPMSYEFKDGDVWYLSRTAPKIEIDVVGFERSWAETSKNIESRVTPRKIQTRRTPRDQNDRQFALAQLMGNSAQDYAQKLIDNGHLVVPPHLTASWFWCSLNVLRHAPSNRSMAKRHIIMATAACHSQMAMIEAVIHRFIDETGCAISLEVFATLFPTTCMADRIRYRLWEPKSDTLLTEYVDARTTTFAHQLDFDALYANFMAAYDAKTSVRN